MSLSAADLKKVKTAFNYMSQNHAEPNAIALWNRTVTQLNEDVQNETAIGQQMLAVLERGVAREGVDKVVARLMNAPQL